MRKRTLARECCLTILYQAEMTRRDLSSASNYYWSDKEDIDNNIKDFSDRLIAGIEKNIENIDKQITQYATNWQLKRMAVIDRNILRLGAFELLYSSDIPPKVTINEAVELAKKFGDVDSSKFVNGILDKIHKSNIVAPEN